ncbi:MAG: NAD-binding protein [Endomicrobium sp.]|nr:NAD-binding protein [Endomicrobium sp.]
MVVGYGPTGKQVVNVLNEQNLNPVIIDTNIDTINSLSPQGFSVVYGDSSQKEILFAAGIKNAEYLIITIPSLPLTLEIATLASSLNPKTKILARARFLDHKENLKQAGVSQAAFEEAEVAKALTSLLLDDLKNQNLLTTASEMASQSTEEEKHK